jgi:hypothetical protein
MPDKAAILVITLLNGHDLLLFPSVLHISRITHLQDYTSPGLLSERYQVALLYTGASYHSFFKHFLSILA